MQYNTPDTRTHKTAEKRKKQRLYIYGQGGGGERQSKERSGKEKKVEKLWRKLAGSTHIHRAVDPVGTLLGVGTAVERQQRLRKLQLLATQYLVFARGVAGAVVQI